MTQVLHLDSSPRGDRSLTRQLSQYFVSLWQGQNPEAQVTYRDIGQNPLPTVDEAWIAASATAPEARTPELAQAIALSDRLIDELIAVDRVVIGLPMHNLSIPTHFKAYIDQIVRSGRTFAVTPNGYQALLDASKKVLVITASGGQFRAGTPTAAYNFQEPYVRAILGFIGLTDLTFVDADGLAFGDEARDASLAAARSKLAELAPTW